MSHANSIAIFAGNKGVLAYLADIVRLAGFVPTAESDAGATMVLATPEGKVPLNCALPVVQLGGTASIEAVRVVAMPAKAATLIDILQKTMQAQGDLPARITIGGYTLYTRENLWIRDGEAPLRLTEKETAILAYLHTAGAPVSREALLERVWSYVPEVETHTLETHIYRLRQKIEEDPSSPKILLTQGDGYSVALE